jgi:hypothetical protein
MEATRMHKFKYEIGDEPSPGFIIRDRRVSTVSGRNLYWVNDILSPFFEDEVEGLSYQ